VAGLLLALANTPLHAQGTLEEREACTPDVFRLCSSFIPDPSAITACLKARIPDLSPNCRSVMAPLVRLEEAGTKSQPRGLR
jgi:hypothetical protein